VSVILKIFPKAACDHENFPKVSHDTYTEEYRPMGEKKSQNRNSDAAFRKILELVSVLKEASRNFILSFLFNKPT
jgi:hypothetical protein